MHTPVAEHSTAVIRKFAPAKHMPAAAGFCMDPVLYCDEIAAVALLQSFLHDQTVSVETAVVVDRKTLPAFLATAIIRSISAEVMAAGFSLIAWYPASNAAQT